MLPAGVRGLYKVTDRSRPGPGEYVASRPPPTKESARRRLALPAENPAEEVREYRTTKPLLANIGQISGSSAGDVQLELQNPAALEEVRRWYLPFDGEVRFGHALEAAAIGGVAGLAVGYALGRPWIGLAIGLVVGFFIGLLFPTDSTELHSILFGSAQTSFLFML